MLGRGFWGQAVSHRAFASTPSGRKVWFYPLAGDGGWRRAAAMEPLRFGTPLYALAFCAFGDCRPVHQL
jgi:hypothetical protein